MVVLIANVHPIESDNIEKMVVVILVLPFFLILQANLEDFVYLLDVTTVFTKHSG